MHQKTTKAVAVVPAIVCYIAHDISWFDVTMYDVIIT